MDDMTNATEFTPGRVKRLIIKHYAGKEPAHRDVIALRVLKEHLKDGGKQPDVHTLANLAGYVGPLLGELKERDLAEFKGRPAKDSRWTILATAIVLLEAGQDELD